MTIGRRDRLRRAAAGRPLATGERPPRQAADRPVSEVQILRIDGPLTLLRHICMTCMQI
jgi:hypothetical protein